MAQVKIQVWRHKIIDLPLIGPKFHYYYTVTRTFNYWSSGQPILDPDLTVHGVAFDHFSGRATGVGFDAQQLVVSVHRDLKQFSPLDEFVGETIVNTGSVETKTRTFETYELGAKPAKTAITSDASILDDLIGLQELNTANLQYLNTPFGESQNSDSVFASGLRKHNVNDSDIEGLSFSSSDNPGADRNLLDPKQQIKREEEAEVNECFAAGTMVDMADGTKKPIEDIRIGDAVMAYDPEADNGRGGLRPSKVTQTHATPNRIVLDFWGTRVTPGHVFLCGDGPYEGQHRMLIDILRDDGAIVRADGTRVRAATNCAVGSAGDRLINVRPHPDLQTPLIEGRLRAGARLPESDGEMTVMEVMATQGYTLLPDGNIVRDGDDPHPLTFRGKFPRPEDFILSRSGVTLDELYSEDTTLRDDPFSVPAPAFTDTRRETAAAGAGPLQATGNRRERRRQQAMQRRRGGEIFH